MKHYIVIVDYCIDGEPGIEIIGVRHTEEEARSLFEQKSPSILEEAKDNGFNEIEEYENGLVTFKSGEYCMNRLVLFIEKSDN